MGTLPAGCPSNAWQTNLLPSERLLSALWRALPQEASLLAALRHPNVLSFIGYSAAPPCIVRRALLLVLL